MIITYTATLTNPAQTAVTVKHTAELQSPAMSSYVMPTLMLMLMPMPMPMLTLTLTHQHRHRHRHRHR
ncbi:hypothetical protein B5P22_27330 [Pseudomonas tolaasii]|nr:hypothetical protein B5P22_27330 [Pseudomonas tolaasii]